MLGLAIDSADRIASAAVWRSEGDGFDVLAQGALRPETGKADQLITAVERLLVEQRLDYGDLDVIAVNRGPGSFTGIRSAVALGRGLALAAGLPVLGITSHEALAARLGGSDQEEHALLIALDARRSEVYVQCFAADGRPLSEIEAKSPAAAADDLEPGHWRLAGSGAGLVVEALEGVADVRLIEVGAIDAGAVALSAAMRLANGEAPVQGFALRPLYVRAPDAVPPAPLISTTAAAEVPI